ncbi:hypothetical protein SAMN05192559_105317 [Halobacillus karajensis]|uniref:Uncharacterized protein n=1 Tax=Halobacillus karajensis TaxID=195088 RepID=A0A024P640_9BACI|nr:DUF6241 domain-containing protein [Halobacillus karajensis]CDQ20420.1 hypothetical protein BN982_02761 [Halobacillus karajensis]CDQ24111.1 hypothetical protein BN983_02376 [Halobacillus karajensis]CDQ27589.1 hypothetical protein BN981_01857 [Halobacillus karajensis]SEH91927.1 hypothetical protein SAMN05192559_105317 [Halobacillus karajensis]
MKKLMLWFSLCLCIGATAGAFLYVQTQAKTTEKGVTGTVSSEELERYEEEGKNPFGGQTTGPELTDKEYQEYIHGMAHQKVKADEKWTFFQIHPLRISWLLEHLETNDLRHKHVYKQILTQWAEGDYSNAVDDHNAIWEIQRGTIGKAKRLLTSEEEEEYIKENN